MTTQTIHSLIKKHPGLAPYFEAAQNEEQLTPAELDAAVKRVRRDLRRGELVGKALVVLGVAAVLLAIAVIASLVTLL